MAISTPLSSTTSPATRVIGQDRRRPVSALTVVVLASGLGIGGNARAQQATDEILPRANTVAAVEPPRPINEAPVSYPEQAIADKYFASTTVVLVLAIDAQGAVTAANPESDPGHGFAEEATTAARKLTFTPAMRDGQAIASRIKYRYLFLPPPPVLVGRIVRASDDKAIAGAAVTVVMADGATHRATTGSDGAYRFSGLSTGAAHVEVTGAGLRPITADELLSYAEETNLVLRAEPAAPATASAAPVTTATDDIAQEVVVHGTKPPREVVKRTLARQEIAQLPGTNGDALRSIESLPGVSRPPPFRGVLIVRGSDADDTTVLIDGTPVPLVYHFGGLSSVVPTEAIDRLDFYPGNFSSAFGRAMGGVVDVGLRDPKADGVHALAQLDLIDLRLMVEAPIAKSGWKVLAGGRRSWFDLWLAPILAASSPGTSVAPRYYDYQLMLQRDFSARSAFRATFFGSDDSFRIVQSGTSSASQGGSLGIATKFWRLQAVYHNQLTDRLEWKATAAGGTDSTSASFGANFITVVEHPLSLRSELSYKVGAKVRANAGVDLIYASYDLALRLPEPTASGTQPNTPGRRTISETNSGSRFLGGAYTEWEISPWRGGRIVPGFRADYASTTSQVDLSPRLNVRQEIFGGPHALAAKGAFGLFFQPPSAAESDPVYGQSNLRSKRSLHYDVGVEQQLLPPLRLSIDAYYKRMDRLVITGSGNSGEGRAYGVETFLRWQGQDQGSAAARLFGWISYTLSRSERRDAPGEDWYRFQYDQTHILTVVGSYDVGRGWRLGGRFRYATGNTYTPTTTGAYDSTVGATVAAESAAKDAARLPDFQQLDIRIDKAWAFKAWKLATYLDVQNVYNYRAIEGVSYNYDYTQTGYTKGLTILPSLGVRGEF